ncbi:MAG: 4-hydroxy-tetrahydrodipicolinate reductase [Bacteroidota bacterium]|jgi:4-hydroxy-tetrahydrodipicolinate reductase
MKIALIGFGKMGQAIAELLPAFGHEIHSTYSQKNTLTKEKLAGADVAIEFSLPQLCVDNINICFEAGVPVVVGTTGWYDQYQELVSKMTTDQALLCATNFSIGVQALFHINKELARILNKFGGYEVSIQEIHHTAKLDKPSGTAITLAEGVMHEMPQYSSWSLNPDSDETNKLMIEALREPEVPGTHEVCYQSEIDTLKILHIAHSRKGFATGAIRAAEFLYNKKGVFTMSDVLNS